MPKIESFCDTTLETPTITIIHDKRNAGFLNLKKSIFCFGNKFKPSNCFTLSLLTNKSAKVRVTKRAQNTEATIPIAMVKPNPLTGPVPSQNKIKAVIKVVTLASNIVEITLLNPFVKLDSGDFPSSRSSRIRSKIRIFASTPIPKVRTSAATPGKVKVAPKLAKIPNTKMTFVIAERTAINPPKK